MWIRFNPDKRTVFLIDPNSEVYRVVHGGSIYKIGYAKAKFLKDNIVQKRLEHNSRIIKFEELLNGYISLLKNIYSIKYNKHQRTNSLYISCSKLNTYELFNLSLRGFVKEF